MYKFLTIILLVFIIACTNHSIDPEELDILNGGMMLNDSLKAVLYYDAQYLEFEEMKKDKDVYLNTPWLNEDHVQKHYNDLITIYSTLFNTDTNFVKYNRFMHFPKSKYLTEILIAVDTSKTWVKNWLDDKQQAGNESIDTIMKLYNLKVEKWHIDPKYNYKFKLIAPFPMNLNVPVQQLIKTNEFIYVERNFAFSGVPDPRLVENGHSRVFVFAYGWGDCPAGCIYKHYWQITVNDKQVTDVLEYGDPLYN